MKNWLLLGLLCITSPIYADGGMERLFYDARGMDHLFLRITIKNNTPNACALIKKQLDHGFISNLILMTDKIPAGLESSLLIYENHLYGSDITLSYFCGDNRFIRFQSQRESVIRGAYTKGFIESAINMDATYDALPGDLTIFGDQPGSIYWTLY